ncbi:rhomboid family intramembrane serine protease [Sphingorhabdus arenilitoris]|uniref:Rhomboid family intramembrane serine protease n=1 Tax=Sphingorhabdus arenilitoris TaxID=1490041 RepID=A0ABV8RF00_9SPHN
MIKRLAPIFVICLIMAGVHIVNMLSGGSLSAFGVHPRELSSIPAIAAAPWLHGDVMHLVNNLIVFAVLGSVCMVYGLRHFIVASLQIIAISGLCVWLFGRDGLHLGASGWIFGLWALIIAMAWFERSIRNIAIAIIIIALYGTMIFGLLPTDRFISFEAHIFGALGGVFAAWRLTKAPDLQLAVKPARSRETDLKFWS